MTEATDLQVPLNPAPLPLEASLEPGVVLRLWRPSPLPGVEVIHAAGRLQDCRSLYEDHALVQTVAGHYERCYQGQRQRGAPGALALGEPGEAYHLRWLRVPAATRAVLIAPEQMTRAARELTGSDRPPGFSASHVPSPEPALAEALERFHERVREPGTPALVLESCFTRLLELLLARDTESGLPERPLSPERRAVRRARQLLEARLEENVSLSELALHAGLSRFHLLRVFRQELGMPPHAYQVRLRVSRARQLLRRGADPGEVAAQVGFVDQSHLTRHFKKHLGLTPGQYARCDVSSERGLRQQ